VRKVRLSTGTSANGYNSKASESFCKQRTSLETVRKVRLSTGVMLSSREYGCQQAPVVTTEKRATAFVNNEH
jgi:hypothetical protein